MRTCLQSALEPRTDAKTAEKSTPLGVMTGASMHVPETAALQAAIWKSDAAPVFCVYDQF